MKTQNLCKNLFLLISLILVNILSASVLQQDPIPFASKTLQTTKKQWTNTKKEEILSLATADTYEYEDINIYLILESPNMVFDSYLGKNDVKDEGIPKVEFIGLLEEILYQPAKATEKLLFASIEASKQEYLVAQEIAQTFYTSKQLNYDMGIRFLDNRFSTEKLGIALEILGQTDFENKSNPSPDKNKKLSKKIASIKTNYSSHIPVVQALTELSDFFTILQKENLGITQFPPYTNFANSIKPIIKQRTQEQITWRPSLLIGYPKSGSIWKTPSRVLIKWQTKNIDSDKTIKFFLTRDDIVVQVLGVFKNTGEIENIDLRKGLPEGDTYKVMGIELFPTNKFHIAKFATPYFSIRKERQKVEANKANEILLTEDSSLNVTATATEATTKFNNVIYENDSKSTDLKTELSAEALEEQRKLFAGRKISYQKKILVDSETLTINLYDHGRQDGDIVSIYLNGKAVIANHILTYKKKSFEVTLDPNKKNDLFLYAHNLGNYPPNTVSLEIKDNSKSEEIILNSDLKSCEAVLIEVQP
ncbi:hypothetical protein [Eudoraea chungangensis]|uniref:hypothetical protein n=1 Tax=Eudoraea chungangensis TaxID=1481905 RepID=UPI0023ECD78F|nr:hypothetical protein [Eudoraea chungangensis]